MLVPNRTNGDDDNFDSVMKEIWEHTRQSIGVGREREQEGKEMCVCVCVCIHILRTLVFT